MLYRIITITVFSLLLSSCQEEKSTSICIEGVVTDSRTKAPLFEATIDLLHDTEWGENSYYTSVQTDKSGSYSLYFANNQDYSDFKLFVFKEGYADTLIHYVYIDKSNCVDKNIKLRPKEVKKANNRPPYE